MVVGFLFLFFFFSSPILTHSSPSLFDYQCGLTTAGWSIPPPPEDVNLKQVIAVIRHGDRTAWNGSSCWPGDDYIWSCDLVHGQMPVDTKVEKERGTAGRIFEKIFLPTNEEMHGNCSVAQLTTIGYKQHLANGGSLNSAYVKNGFLTPSLDPSQVFIRSDDIPRTILSAQSLMDGMFPQDGKCEDNGDDGCTQFVPLYTRDTMYDNMEANADLCPKVTEYQTQFYESTTWLNHLKTTIEVVNNISNTIGFNISDNFEHFCDCLITHYCHNASWPDKLTEDLALSGLDEMVWMSYNSLKYPSVQENARAGIGFLLKDIWKNFNRSVNGEDYEKFSLYSGHDTTLIQLLVALGIDEGIWPPYSSMMLFELYSTSTAPAAVRVLYNGKIKTLPFCNGQELCSYETFSNYLSTVTPPDDYQKFCQV
ncbi:PREDICTED: counting factor 60-like [Amphimedon queenslandica]|uniref:Acid phosphatase n=1 Tax=Amphimedon queenslandica TaxID=400682 RepID=A0A1X7TVT7_AMPQE|nr:PREDICTED: counting factor 60-like [Amphimedon queenslandica]|eukprot:XP_011406697.1 PREDICTED: counting factor 60-like [Amphimedon queenslandica]